MAGCTKLRIGMRVKLKQGAFPYVKIREWEIFRIEKGIIVLRCPRNYTLEVLQQDIECE